MGDTYPLAPIKKSKILKFFSGSEEGDRKIWPIFLRKGPRFHGPPPNTIRFPRKTSIKNPKKSTRVPLPNFWALLNCQKSFCFLRTYVWDLRKTEKFLEILGFPPPPLLKKKPNQPHITDGNCPVDKSVRCVWLIKANWISENILMILKLNLN